ncbi:MAG: phage virion morphogenesis protein [Betaproteobacteria bacterium]|nr:phage virion morphogenesis protein [Betaproteobacteria bacterium]
MIKIEIQDSGVLRALNELLRRGGDLAPALADVGELLVGSTKTRFAEGRGPGGEAWPPNTRATLEAFLYRASGAHSKTGKRTGTKKGYFRDDGRLGAKGAGVVMSKRPLIGESKRLGSEIVYRVSGNTLLVGSALEYSAVQQFGAKKGAFGKTRRGAPVPWGDIPPRPFLGISDADRAGILDIMNDYLAGAARE